MDLNLNYSEDESPLSLKSDFILSLCELIVGGRDGLKPIEKTVIDRAVRLVYRKYLADPRPENMPIPHISIYANICCSVFSCFKGRVVREAFDEETRPPSPMNGFPCSWWAAFVTAPFAIEFMSGLTDTP